ncbi:hypothetical protein PVAP13_4KG019200 [Panicum virgatum]|uniref:Uncharacterized protein n=1 Tax=Panicum virgatum TaxID=38727 RepID=A0A8T0TMT4_PANVG|nr:hypothetical protein PVAP13_4KG019200 [Panicum virgatum]
MRRRHHPRWWRHGGNGGSTAPPRSRRPTSGTRPPSRGAHAPRPAGWWRRRVGRHGDGGRQRPSRCPCVRAASLCQTRRPEQMLFEMLDDNSKAGAGGWEPPHSIGGGGRRADAQGPGCAVGARRYLEPDWLQPTTAIQSLGFDFLFPFQLLSDFSASLFLG